MASFAQPAMQSDQTCSSFYNLKKDNGDFVKVETHVMVLHTNRKFVVATPTSVTDGPQWHASRRVQLAVARVAVVLENYHAHIYHARTDAQTTKILMY